MSELTQESLEKALMEMTGLIEAMGERVALKPTRLIVPPFMFRNMMYRAPVRKARGIRGRKRALYWRSRPIIWGFIRSGL